MVHSRRCNPDWAAYVRSSVIRALATLLLATIPVAAQIRSDRFALILQDKPVAEQATSRKEMRNSAASARLQIISTAQNSLRRQLETRGIRVTGSTKYLLNAVFVAAPESRVDELRKMPGVVNVYPVRPLKRHLSRAIDLIRARQAWEVAGGQANAGAGVKIGILDSGIDHNHPGFQQNLPAVSGFPKCRPEDCAYTNSKVIVARSYVEGLVLGDDPVDSRPDDLTPRDRSGHGTAMAMIAAGAPNEGPAGSIVGVAPAAYV
jgi:minor extracellular serine protease Vpr